MALSQYKMGALLSYGTLAFNAVAGLVYTPWMVRSIGADDYGLYTLAISVINVFLVDFGLSCAVTRFLSRYYASGSLERIPPFLGIVYKLYAALAGAVFIVLLAFFFCIDTLYQGLTAEEVSVFKVLYVIVASYGVISLPLMTLDGILGSNERFVGLNLCNLVQKVATVLLIVACLVAGAGVYALVACNAVVGLAMSLVKCFIVRSSAFAKVDWKSWDSKLAREVAGFSGWSALSTFGERFSSSVLPSVLGMVADAQAVAIFGLANILGGYLYSAASVLDRMFLPKAARVLEDDSDAAKLQSFMVTCGRYQLIVMGLLFVGFIALGDRFVFCWMGDGYEVVWGCAIALMVPNMMRMPQNSGEAILDVMGVVKEKALIRFSMLVLTLLLAFPLSLSFGVMGACMASCVAGLVRAVVMMLLFRRKIGCRIGDLLASVYVRWVVSSVVVAAFGLGVSHLPFGGGWRALLLMAFAVTCAYLLAMYAVVLTRGERRRIVGFFGRKLKRG